MSQLDDLIESIGRQRFRAKFHLRGRDRATAILRGPAAIRTTGSSPASRSPTSSRSTSSR
jgi:hypothetical protein